MKSLNASFAEFLLYVYTTHVKEEDVLNRFGRAFVYPFWLVRSFFVWIFCPLLLPEYLFKRTDTYRRMKKYQDSEEFQERLSKSAKNFRL